MLRIPYFQEGGGVPQEQMQAPQGGGEDPTAQLQAMVQEYSQSRDSQLAVHIADTLVEAMGLGGGEPQAPQGPPAGDPNAGGQQFKNGGKLTALQKLKNSKR